jgi:UDP-N-acetylglucosamine 3-dehydrogenase
MKKVLNVAVIGVGVMGKTHVRVYSELAEVKLAAVMDINEQLGKEIANKYGTAYYNDIKELIGKEKLDAVSICVPTSLHFKIAKMCINAGINVLVEKPITSNISDAKKLLRLAKDKNVKLLVGHIERFNPAVNKVKEIIERGDLGSITAIIARRVGGFPPQIKDTNIAVDLMIHDVDIINYLLNELPLKVYFNKRSNHIKNREDSSEFFMKYKNTSAYLQANWITPVKIRKLNITGTEGYLEMDYIDQTIEFYKSNYEKFFVENENFSDYILRFSNPSKSIIPVEAKEPLKEEILYFINAILKNKEINSDFALDALKIVLKK